MGARLKIQEPSTLTYDDMAKMSDEEVDCLLFNGVQTGKLITIKSRVDFRRLVAAHDRLAAKMAKASMAEIKKLAGYCMELGI